MNKYKRDLSSVSLIKYDSGILWHQYSPLLRKRKREKKLNMIWIEKKRGAGGGGGDLE